MAVSTQIDGQVLPPAPVHALSPISSNLTLPSPGTFHPPLPTDLPRSASFTYLPVLEKENTGPPLKRTFSENVLSVPPEHKSKVNDLTHATNLDLLRLASRKAKRKMTGGRFSLTPDEHDSGAREETKVNPDKDEQPRSLSRSVAGTIRTLARKSWAPSSSSSSPPPRKESHSPERKRSWSPDKNNLARPSSLIAVPERAASTPPLLPSPQNYDGPSTDEVLQPALERGRQQGTTQRPFGIFQARNKSESSVRRLSRNSSATSLRSYVSNERSQSRASLARRPPLPPSLSSDRLAALTAEVSRRKDPLLGPFRSLDGEFAAFQAKTSLQKAKVLRLTLIPFLVKHEHHPSNQNLRAEDLDRRAVVLNKWWTALLEMLHGANNQSISGTDRPAFLESASRLMSRPEWRIPDFVPAAGDSPLPNPIPKSKSSNSLESDDTDFLVDTIHQNVRNMFVQNLLSQMEFVVDSLSLRTAPGSLVTFAGKACAYAFLFCPGVADMLVRLWCLPPIALRRIFRQLEVEPGDKVDLISHALSRYFPPAVRSLSIGSQAAFSRHIQQRGQVPRGSENVNWFQPWVSRWSGHNSDLFFVFTKQYHVLISEFVVEDLSPKERVGIPGLVPICAQMMIILETTIYRQAGQNTLESYSPGIGSNMDNPDALAPLPMTIANASRSIAENRLIMVLRDVLGDLDPDHTILRNLFLGSFSAVTKAATTKISVYNNDACFVICDFMEEVLPIMFRYHQTYMDTPVFDWLLVLDMCKHMMQSQTTLTQIRVISFLYSTWSILIHNEERRRQLVLDWLLDVTVFEEHFCHWSPMVRHYFYRLLCWRVARCDGPVSELDLEILQTLATRLNKCWANYQYLGAEAEMRGLTPPSSAPCTPAPSRILVIVRTDSQPIITHARTNFEKFVPSAIVTQSSPYQHHSSALNTIPSADLPVQGNKKRWSIFRGLAVFGSAPGNSRPGEVTPPGSPEETSPPLSIENTPGPNSAITIADRPSTPPHQLFSFKFSLEFVQHRPNLENKNRILTSPQLPGNANSILRAHQSSESRGSSSSSGGSGGSLGSGPSGGSDFKTRARVRAGEVKPLKPKDHEMGTARYSGRALAEWAQVVHECRSFYNRRRQEGVPRDNLIETPTMGVENFRLMAG